jgi:serine/threonine-protein kinase
VAFLSASVPGVAREPDATATEAMPARPARRRLGLAVGVVGAVASAGAIWGLAHRAAPRVPPSDLEPPRVSAAAAAPPVPVAAVAASVASPIAPPRRAQVRITPPSAAVDVDGLPSPVTRGSVEVTGDLGTVHRVHLKVGSREATTEVILAEDGARPRVVTLAAGRAPPDAAKPAAVLPAAPAPALAASANKPPPKFDTTFE